jgi:glycosyltransferase involved in cell wall biosynthesis
MLRMRRKKVTYRILTCYYRPKPGGFSKRLFRAINALLSAGHEVHYLTVVRFPINHPDCYFHRFPWPEGKTEGYVFWAFFHIIAPIQLFYLSFRYRINRLFAFEHNYSVLFQPARIIKKISLTLFLRADTLKNHRIKGRSKWLLIFEHLLEGFGIAGVNVYGVSQTLINDVNKRHKLFKAKTSGVLRNDIKRIHSVKKKEATLPLRLANVGILEERKKQRFLLEIMKKMQPEQVQLYLYGVGPDEQLLRKAVNEENLADLVHFMGWVKPQDIWPNIDLLLMPSLHEGAPNAVLEAIANCVPVLASSIPEHFEILSKKQLLPIGNPLSWKEMIEDICRDPKNQLQNIIREQRDITLYLMFDWEQEIVKCILLNSKPKC